MIYIAVAFMILFTLWFGMYGAIAAYVGTLIGSGLLTPSFPPAVAVYWSIAGLLQVLIPLAALRSFDVDLTLENRRDWTILILFGVLINNVVGAAWGAWTLSLIAPGTFGSIFATWLIGNIIVTLLILPASLKFFTRKIQRSRLFVKYYWE